MARCDHCRRRNRDRGIPDQSNLVPAMESESVLRKGVRRNSLRSPGDTLHTRAWSSNSGSQVTTENSTTNRPRINSANSTDGSATWRSSANIRSIANRLRKSFPRTCWTGFCKYKPKARNGSGMIIPLISSSECRTSFRLSWRIRTGC